MGLVLKTFFLLFKARVHYWLNIEGPYRASYESLISEHSYRLGEGYHKKIFIGFIFLKKSILTLFSSKNPAIVNSEGSRAVFDGSIDPFRLRESYLRNLNHEVPTLFCARNALSITNHNGIKMLSTIAVLLLAFLYLPLVLFSKKRATYGLLFLEFSEWILLQIILKNNKIDYLYLFSSFEVDSNIICLLMKDRGITTHRIPSSNPLYPYYKNVVCDVFSFTSAFQLDERKKFKNWFVGQTDEMPPFNYEQLLKTETGDSYNNCNTIGFISSGVWRRKQRGDLAAGIGEYESEELLIQTIAEILKDNRLLKLYIYFHPCEKESDEIYNSAIALYKEQFPEASIEFCPRSTSSLDMFYKSNVAVSVYSSTNIERLFLGMKTYYFPAKFKVDLFKDTSLEKILLYSSSELKKEVLNAINGSNSEFMTNKDLEKYFHFGIPKESSVKT